MNNEPCPHGGNAPASMLTGLHLNQGGSGRHMCPICAYEHGFLQGGISDVSYEAYCASTSGLEICPQGSAAPSFILQSLGENQGGTGRHKCPNCAFKMGFEAGVTKIFLVGLHLNLVETPSLELPKVIRSFKPRKGTDFIKKEIENKKLGLLGEQLVVKHEKDLLVSNHREDLAELVEHSSAEKGDGLGYDILSYDLDENKKFIEVKTTRADISRPFYLSRNELDFSEKEAAGYFLYRVFDFDSNMNSAKFYIIQGDLGSQLHLDPREYLACPI